MEGYYEDTIFHRIIKDFIAQGGDPSGTGDGGESIYGHPFKVKCFTSSGSFTYIYWIKTDYFVCLLSNRECVWYIDALKFKKTTHNR